ncbi:hypothetical protein B0H16DRAFT_1446456 [Mycena metata]|uniref:Ribonuclease H1 N-terminal domain-containing protein n=1 Tax=Mycena metata TaxID=1033252 RepID=A0AAD7P1L6_9AGAR|nr:hypothetical protein B0H16DRAFT_1446456 [Mycena metata]
MTSRTSLPDYGDAELIALIVNLDLSSTIGADPPRTPPRVSPSAPTQLHTFPSSASRHVRAQQTIYQFESPSGSGYTSDWSSAGFATQAVPNGRVRAVQQGRSKKKNGGKKAAYTVFCGLRCGVFNTWAETRPLVTAIPNSIFKGYTTRSEAQAAFDYATARGWTRVANHSVASGIPQLPRPINMEDTINALNNDTDFDGKWYIVYRGITPGVYRSHLESQLNTVGVPGALHESILGLSNAMEKYTKAIWRGETASAAPPPYHDVFS